MRNERRRQVQMPGRDVSGKHANPELVSTCRSGKCFGFSEQPPPDSLIPVRRHHDEIGHERVIARRLVEFNELLARQHGDESDDGPIGFADEHASVFCCTSCLELLPVRVGYRIAGAQARIDSALEVLQLHDAPADERCVF